MRNDAARFATRRARPEPLADDLERRPAAHRGDPAGHLREHADADDADHHDPGQRQPEPGADHGVGDEVADVEEPADRGEDAEGDGEDLAHHPPPRFVATRSSCSAAAARPAVISATAAAWSGVPGTPETMSASLHDQVGHLIGGIEHVRSLAGLVRGVDQPVGRSRRRLDRPPGACLPARCPSRRRCFVLARRQEDSADWRPRRRPPARPRARNHPRRRRASTRTRPRPARTPGPRPTGARTHRGGFGTSSRSTATWHIRLLGGVIVRTDASSRPGRGGRWEAFVRRRTGRPRTVRPIPEIDRLGFAWLPPWSQSSGSVPPGRASRTGVVVR